MACGGLCNPNHIARFLQLDTATTKSAVGYDDIFGEPKLVVSGVDDPRGTVGRRNIQYDVECQVEVVQASDRLEQTQQGKNRQSKYEVTVERYALDIAGLIDSNGECKIRTGARLEKFMDRAGNQTLAFKDPPGLYVEQIDYDSWFDSSFSIIVFTCTPRQRAV